MELQSNLFKLHLIQHLIKTAQRAPRHREHVTMGIRYSFLENYINEPGRKGKESPDCFPQGDGNSAPETTEEAGILLWVVGGSAGGSLG